MKNNLLLSVLIRIIVILSGLFLACGISYAAFYFIVKGRKDVGLEILFLCILIFITMLIFSLINFCKIREWLLIIPIIVIIATRITQYFSGQDLYYQSFFTPVWFFIIGIAFVPFCLGFWSGFIIRRFRSQRIDVRL